MNHLVRLLQIFYAKFPKTLVKDGRIITLAHLYVFVKMHWLIVDVMPHEEVIDTGQEGHLRQGEYVHELFHGVAMGTLQDSN